MAKLLIIVGIICILIGLYLLYGPRIPFVGRMPGDVTIKKENFTFHFPIMTSIVLSIVLSLLLYLINRFR